MHTLDHLFTSPALRPQQIEYIDTLRKWLSTNTVLMLESDTGTGKARANMIAAAEWSMKTGMPALMTAPTMEHRWQLREEAIYVKNIVNAAVPGAGLEVTTYISKRTVISPERVQAALRGANDPHKKNLLIDLTDRLKSTELLTYDGWRINLGDDIDLAEFVGQQEVCYGARDEAPEGLNSTIPRTGFVITTTAMALVNRSLRGMMVGDDDPNDDGLRFCCAFFDEAHKIIEVAQGLLRKTTSFNALRELHQEIPAPSKVDLDVALESFEAAVNAYMGDVSGCEFGERSVVPMAARKSVETAQAAYRKLVRKVRRQRKSVRAREAAVQIMDALPFEEDPTKNRFVSTRADLVNWFERKNGDITMSVEPAYPGGILWWLPKAATECGCPVAFTSATLSMKDQPSKADYMWITKLFGRFTGDPSMVSEHSKRIKVRNFGHVEWVYPCPSMPLPTINKPVNGSYTNPEVYDFWAKLIRLAFGLDTLRGNPGQNRVLVLCHTISDADRLAELLHDLKPIVARDMPNWRSLFAKTPRSILLSVAWEGIDLVSEVDETGKKEGLVDHLVITRLPYAPRNAAKIDRIASRMEERGSTDDAAQSAALGVVMAENKRWMKFDLGQGIGRLIRQQGDRGRVLFGDIRISLPRADRRNLKHAYFSRRFFLPGGDQNTTIPERWRDGRVSVFNGNDMVDLRDWQPPPAIIRKARK